MMKAVLSPEQCAQMVNLGVDTDSADMCRIGDDVQATPYETIFKCWTDYVITDGTPHKIDDSDLHPAWSLAALMSMLPQTINDYNLIIIGEKGYYEVGYQLFEYSPETQQTIVNDMLTTICREELINALYAMFVWLCKHNYIKSLQSHE